MLCTWGGKEGISSWGFPQLVIVGPTAHEAGYLTLDTRKSNNAVAPITSAVLVGLGESQIAHF